MAEINKFSTEQLDAQIGALKELATTSIDPCVVAKYIALLDSRVRDLFSKKFQDGYLFRGIYCLPKTSVTTLVRVLFNFDCIPGTLCLVPPAFLVSVNFHGKYVESIADPYMLHLEGHSLQESCGCDSSPKELAGNAYRRDACASITITDGKACLKIDYAGDVCIAVPSWIPNGTVAEVCVDVCKKFGIPAGAKAVVKVAGQEVAKETWGLCD